MTTQHPSRRIASLAVLACLILAMALSGCSRDEPTAPLASNPIGDDFSAIDFNAPFGGLTTSNEPPAFGDPDMLSEDSAAEGEGFADDWADDPYVRALIEQGQQPGEPDDPLRPRFTFVRILWGKLDLDDDTATEEIDWSGRLNVDRGIVLVRRVISFERPYDHILRPRPDRHTVAWHSQAGHDYDGLLIMIIEPPRRGPGPGRRAGEDDPLPPEPNRLHFETGPFTQIFLVSELASLDAAFQVEAPGQAIHFTGSSLGDLSPCPRGFLAGRWMDTEAGGFFHGRWISIQGPVLGHLRGAFGTNEESERVFFGKVIGRRGEFLGLLVGTWAPGQRPGAGWFRGRWFGRDQDVLGVLDGNYLMHPDRPIGPFHGRWSALCDDETSGQIGAS